MHAPRLRRRATGELGDTEVTAIRALLDAAFRDDGEGFTDLDWAHAVGGRHYVLDLDGTILAHASVVERILEVDGRPHRTGYVEAVATAPEAQGRGHGTLVMEAVTADIVASYELGALSTGPPAFYERLGWRPWSGPTSTRTAHGRKPTPDDDGAILVIATSTTPTDPPLDPSAPISCDWRPGDVW